MTDKEFLNTKEKIKFLMSKARDPEHSFTHGERVANNALKIVEILGVEEKIDLNLLKVCCYLHDLPISMHRLTLSSHINEPSIIRRHLPGVLEQLELSDSDKKIIFNAIIHHPHSYPYHVLNRKRDVYTKILQDADTLDLFSKEREVILEKNKEKFIEYKEFGLISRVYFGFGKSHIRWFLNYPEVVEKFFSKDQINIKNGSKVAVLIHGFPEPLYPDTPLFKYFSDKGYSVVAPYLFSSEFKLSQNAVESYINEKLMGKKPNVIVGVSMGGLLAPALAKDFPHAKLILIGTGPYVKPDLSSLHFLIKITKSKFFDVLYRIIELTPTPIYSFLYRLFNHPKMSETQKAELAAHIVKNWQSIKSVSESEDREVINFLTSVDNSTLLHSLKNKTLIFAADGDSMMPLSLASRLKSLIKRSRLIVNKGTIHYTVFGKNNYKDLDDFLSN